MAVAELDDGKLTSTSRHQLLTETVQDKLLASLFPYAELMQAQSGSKE